MVIARILPPRYSSREVNSTLPSQRRSGRQSYAPHLSHHRLHPDQRRRPLPRLLRDHPRPALRRRRRLRPRLPFRHKHDPHRPRRRLHPAPPTPSSAGRSPTSSPKSLPLPERASPSPAIPSCRLTRSTPSASGARPPATRSPGSRTPTATPCPSRNTSRSAAGDLSLRTVSRYQSNRGSFSRSAAGTSSTAPPDLIHAFNPPSITRVGRFSSPRVCATRTLVVSRMQLQYR